MSSDTLYQSCGALLLCIFTVVMIYKVFRNGKDNVFRGMTCKNCWTGPHAQGTLNRDGLCKSCIKYKETKAHTQSIESKLIRHRMIDNPAPIHSELDQIDQDLDRKLNDILISNHYLNQNTLYLIRGYLGKYAFMTNDDLERLFALFEGTESRSETAWRDYDDPTFYAVKVEPENMDYVLKNTNKSQRRQLGLEWSQRTPSTMQSARETVVALYRELFIPQNEGNVYQWTAYDWSYAANRYYPSTDPQRSMQRSYLFAKPRRADRPMYGLMLLKVIPVGL